MRKQSRIRSVHLSELADLIYRELDKVRGKGWFSNFVSEQLVSKYSRNLKQKILLSLLNDRTDKRNKLDKEIAHIAEQLKKVKKNV